MFLKYLKLKPVVKYEIERNYRQINIFATSILLLEIVFSAISKRYKNRLLVYFLLKQRITGKNFVS